MISGETCRDDNITVSIIMPVYNCLKYLKAALDSITKQCFQSYEIIAVDDGSTDGSGPLLDEYALHNEKLKVIHVPNGGPSKARNIGLDHARGQWIQFMDSDDILENDMLLQMYQNSEQVDMVVSGAYREDLENGRASKMTLTPVYAKETGEISVYLSQMNQDTKDLLLNYLWNKWFRRSIIILHHIRFDESLRLGEDFMFNCAFMQYAQSFMAVNEAYYHYYIRGNGSLAHTFSWNEPERRNMMYQAFLELLETFHVKDTMKSMVSCNEGKYCWIGISKVMLKDCNLEKAQKVEYIRKFMTDMNRNNMLCYFDTRKGMTIALRKWALQHNKPRIIYRLLCLHMLPQKMKRMVKLRK